MNLNSHDEYIIHVIKIIVNANIYIHNNIEDIVCCHSNIIDFVGGISLLFADI